jgi:hypothetical protein
LVSGARSDVTKVAERPLLFRVPEFSFTLNSAFRL